jgi:hypothetical protein
MKRTVALVGLIVLIGAVSVYGAQTTGGGPEGGQMMRQMGGGESRSEGGRGFGPPPEAYQACVGKTAGATAQFTNPEGEVVTGTCREADGRLVLRPDQPKGQGREGRHGPPPEAYTACEGKNAGAVSQFTDPRGEVLKGVCEEEGGKLVLRPDRNRSERSGQVSGDAGTGRGMQ